MSDDHAPHLSWRPATTADAAFCFSVYASTRAEELAAWGWDAAQQQIFLQMQFAAQAASYRAAFPAAAQAILLRGDRPVGTLIVNQAAEEIRLVDISLLPEHRGAGLGTEIIRRLQAEAHGSGRPLRLQVLKTNPATRLYARLGFVATGSDEMRVEMASRARA
ncbi:MAG TPA: GNAT family N-acetyltransferase [Opitutaceae bacterium]|jgi:GNAT superfamily N-acetyltransferase|nr:GNAT family N-acetyltransferase [Opitutaceae bacterium]